MTNGSSHLQYCLSA